MAALCACERDTPRPDGLVYRPGGHAHSYTPWVAAIIAAMHDGALDAETRARTMAEMIVKLACLAAERVFPGPRVSVHYVFPEPGVYHLFFELAPGGMPRVFHCMLQVQTFRDGIGAGLRSILAPAQPQP